MRRRWQAEATTITGEVVHTARFFTSWGACRYTRRLAPPRPDGVHNLWTWLVSKVV